MSRSMTFCSRLPTIMNDQRDRLDAGITEERPWLRTGASDHASNRPSATVDRVRFADLSPSRVLTVSMAVLSTMPLAYLIDVNWSFNAVWEFAISLTMIWVFAISLIIIVMQGLVLLVSCGLKSRHGELRCYGLFLFLYGVGASAMAFWLAALATFGGPARDQVPLFLAKLWIVAAVLFIPPGLYLRRRGVELMNR